MIEPRSYESFTSRACALLLALTLGLAGCARLEPPALRAGDDAFDEVHIASYGSADPADHRVVRLPGNARKPKWFFLVGTAPRRPLGAADKLHPVLREWIATLPSTNRVEVLVAFVDTVRMKRFPMPDRRAARSNPVNGAALDSAAAMIDSLILLRSAQFTADTTFLKTSLGVTITRTYWITQAALMTVEVGRIQALAASPQVVFVRPNIGPEAPDHDNIPENDIIEARARIGSDHYYDLGLAAGWMALLDTGVRTTHALLWDANTKQTNLCLVADYVTPGFSLPAGHACNSFASDGSTPWGGDEYSEGHGTSTAAILVGNGNTLPGTTNTEGRYRGVTHASLDCFRVYRPDRKLSPNAALLGFQGAIARLNQVIVAEMQDTTDLMDPVARSADQAYEAGIAVIAANGNYLAWGPGIPARGKRAMGVGQFSVRSNNYMQNDARGPTRDGRLKPDIMAPTATETAGNLSTGATPTGHEVMRGFSGTSGATPYAAGAAMLVQNWMNAEEGSDVDPGQVYAHLILSGDRVGPFVKTDATGAGRMRLPTTGSGRFGKTWVSKETRHVDVPIVIAASEVVRTLSAAVWWPESTVVENGQWVDKSNNVDLEIVSPGLLGSVQATSNGKDGVFERASVSRTGGITGTWILRIRATDMRTEWPQVVYWSASLTP